MRRALLYLCLAFTAAFAFVVADALGDGENALIQRKYKDAIPHLRRALEDGKPEQKDRTLLLLARAQVLSGDLEGGVATYAELGKQVPGSPLERKARFSAAEALAQGKRFREAAAIYRDEIEKLIGLARKEEVATTYLGLAEQALQQEQPDYPRAVSFFDLALDLGLSPAKERSVKLLAAEARLKGGDFADAIARFQPLAKNLTREQGQLRAMLGLGKSRRLAGDKAGARSALRDLLAQDRTAPEAGDAAYEIALSYGVPAPSAAELDRAVEALADLAKGYATHPKAKIANFLVAQCHQALGRGDAALAAARLFLEQHGSEDLPEVPLARVLVGDVLQSQGKLAEAIDAWRAYLKAHPAHGEWERVQRAIVDAEYGIAWAEYQLGKEHFGKARELFDAFAKAYPIEPRNPDILDLLGEMLAQEKKFDEAKDAYARCVSKYPNTAPASHSQFRIAEIFENETFNYLEALRAYRKVTWGPWAVSAQGRVALLEKKHMHVLTARTFRTGEPAAFRLTSRNIEKVRVRVWRLDLETYFRAKHGIGNVERLDIEVIAPDKEFESSVKDYKQYQQTEREVEIGWKDAGAYVVKVDDKELESTALVLVTDLAVITKSSRHELLVFAQNQKENRVEAGTKIVLSDGGKVLAEGVTGADGCWSWKGKELQSAAGLSVFAIAPGGSGASNLDLTGLGYSPGLKATGYLFTDRPGYLPGQLVHVKGIVREVKDGLYTMPAQKGYVATIVSPGGRLLLRRDIEWSGFGTFGVDLPLPVDAELGDWQVLVRESTQAETFTAKFTVARFERPRVALSAEPTTPVVFRGEHIAGKIVAKYFYGEPVVGRVVHYELALPDGGKLEGEAKTNAAGEVPFDFDTKEFGEEALAVVTARLVEENVGTQLVVPVVTTEFVPQLTVVRPVYLVGETFDVSLTLADRAGKKLAKSGVVKLFRVETKGTVATEVLVAEKPFTSDAKTGAATVGFTTQKGGPHVARLEAKDRFGTLVTGQIGLEISGADDQIKLRLLGDRQSYKVGEVASVKISNRVGKKLVLQTLQGDGILERKAIVLEAGETTLELPLAPEHAPNFALALAMIDGDRLHVAEREFLVARDLQVTVTPSTSVAKPGDEIEVEVTAKDPKGTPVKAEVALALVDEAVFAVFPDPAGPLGAHFWGKRRETAFRTTSSCTWKSAGITRPVSKEIVAEERRELEAAKPAAPTTGVFGDETRAAEVLRFGAAVDDLAKRKDAKQTPGAPAPGLKTMAEQERGVAKGRADLRRGGSNGPGGGGGRGGRDGNGTEGKDRDKADVAGMNQVASGSDEFYLGGQFAGFTQETSLEQLARVVTLAEPGASAKLQMDLATSSPRKDFSETGAWLSALVTDERGIAKTKVKLPESTTGFKLTARGVTMDTYVGEAAGSLRTQKSLQATILAPSGLTEGDATTLSARVHNLTDAARPVAVTLESTVRGETKKTEQTGDVKAHAELESPFPLVAGSGDDIALTLGAKAGADSDALVRTIPVQPFGIELRDGRSGATAENELVKLSLPPGREYSRLALAVELVADPGQDLVALALGSGWRSRSCIPVQSTSLVLASHGLAALLAWDHLEATGTGTPTDVLRLRSFVEGLLGQLVSLQIKDGAFAWIGQQNGDVRSTAQVLTFFAMAGKRGFVQAGDPAHKAAEWLLRKRLDDAPSRARAALALTLFARGRFEELNALHRSRANLDLESLARLGLAWVASSRTDLAAEVGTALRTKLAFAGSLDSRSLEARALAIAALASIDAKDPLVEKGIAYLAANRTGGSFGTAEATAAAVWAFARAGGSNAARAARSEVTVVVNGKTLVTVPATAQQTQTTWYVPAADVRERDNQIEIKVAGKGLVRWSTVLTGFAKGFRPEDRHRELAEIQRAYLPALRRVDNKPVRPGFASVTGEYKPYENLMTMLEVGKGGRVRTTLSVLDTQRGEMTPLVFEEPIPAGCTVPRDSVRGGFEHFEIAPDKLTFYLREGQSYAVFEYELQARFAGSYRVLPPRASGALRPDLVAYGEPATFQVLPAGTASTDSWRATPDELYALGKHAFDHGDFTAAAEHLRPLFDGWKLHENVHKDVARMLLFVAIEKRDTAQIVRCFEDLKDRYQDLVIPFDKIVAVGKAYLDQGEFERSLMVFRAAAEASFVKEAAVATTLENAGEVKASARFLRRLIQTYPDLNTIRVSLYSLAQKEAGLAAAQTPGAPVNERVGRADELRAAALHGLREFLVLYPEDTLAEEVSFAWATTLLEGKDVAGALRVAQDALARYPGSTFEDEELYTVGYCHFALGKHDEAFAVLDRVVKETFVLPGGGRGPSENKFHAIYLQGQIHHALGHPDKALACYEQVKERFSDAGEATDYFLRKALSLPEVSSIAMADKAEIAISYRNVEKVEVKVYRVDLMRLYLLEKSLNDIRGVELHGINPFATLQVTLGDGRDYRTKEKKIELALDKAGAYLVVARGSDLLATGMVLKSDLKIEAQESLDVGRARVNVKRGEAFLTGAHVKVVGSGGDQAFKSGDTDLRGIFVADNLVGMATVIVKKDDEYAFYRGTGIHQPQSYVPQQQIMAPSRAPQRPEFRKGSEFDALNNNINFNQLNRARQSQWLQQEVLNKPQQGVEVYKTK